MMKVGGQRDNGDTIYTVNVTLRAFAKFTVEGINGVGKRYRVLCAFPSLRYHPLHQHQLRHRVVRGC